MASIQDIDEKKEVEVSKEAWLLISTGVVSVTVALEAGASPIASRLFSTDNLVAAAIDQPVLFLSNRVAAFGESGARFGLYGVLRSPGGRPAQF
jgi:hypothetical protein